MKLSPRIGADNIPIWLQIIELFGISVGLMLRAPFDIFANAFLGVGETIMRDDIGIFAPPAPPIQTPTAPYLIALANDLPAGPRVIMSGGGVTVQASGSGSRLC